MKMKLISTKDYLLLIDEEAEIKDCYYYNSLDKELRKNNNLNYSYHHKVVAYYPLTKEAKELDLPLLPNPFEDENETSQEGFDEQLWENYRKLLNRSMFLLEREAFIEGYKAAQSKQFSLEDMKKAIDLTQQICDRNAHYVQRDRNVHVPMITINEEEEIIQSLSTQQLPKEFVPTIFYRTSNSGRIINLKEYSGFSEQMKLQCKLYFASNNNSEGKEVLIGTYKY